MTEWGFEFGSSRLKSKSQIRAPPWVSVAMQDDHGGGGEKLGNTGLSASPPPYTQAMRRQRKELGVELRKARRDEQILKRRNICFAKEGSLSPEKGGGKKVVRMEWNAHTKWWWGAHSTRGYVIGAEQPPGCPYGGGWGERRDLMILFI